MEKFTLLVLLSVVISAVVECLLLRDFRMISRSRSVHVVAMTNSEPTDPFNASDDVQEVLQRIMSILATKSPAVASISTSQANDLLDMSYSDVLNSQYKKILDNIRDSPLTDLQKMRFTTELNMTMIDLKEGISNADEFQKSAKQQMETGILKTTLFSEKSGPYCICTSQGSVGLSLQALTKSMGKAVIAKFIDADQLTTMQDSELKFCTRDAKTIIIAADNKAVPKKGWFDSDPEFSGVTAAGIKRLLNAAMNERNRSPDPYNVSFLVDMTQ